MHKEQQSPIHLLSTLNFFFPQRYLFKIPLVISFIFVNNILPFIYPFCIMWMQSCSLQYKNENQLLVFISSFSFSFCPLNMVMGTYCSQSCHFKQYIYNSISHSFNLQQYLLSIHIRKMKILYSYQFLWLPFFHLTISLYFQGC